MDPGPESPESPEYSRHLSTATTSARGTASSLSRAHETHPPTTLHAAATRGRHGGRRARAPFCAGTLNPPKTARRPVPCTLPQTAAQDPIPTPLVIHRDETLSTEGGVPKVFLCHELIQKL